MMLSSLFYSLLLLTLIHSSIATNYNQACQSTEDCVVANGNIPGWFCSGNRCKCDTPYYTPCNGTLCLPKVGLSYEGDGCRHESNCIINAACRDNLCRCRDGYTAHSRLCFKKLNEVCVNSDECWSRSCFNTRCTCQQGYQPKDDSRCERKLAKIYANWESASAAGDFCYGDGNHACLAPWAECANETGRIESYCRCPTPDYRADYENQECILEENDQLSPFHGSSIDQQPCGKCKDPNALCVQVDARRTCWCRAGYAKIGDKCEPVRATWLFPNRIDIIDHSFVSNCNFNGSENNLEIRDGLCVCAPGYTFNHDNSTCHKIVIPNYDQDFEHGVCTRLASNGRPVNANGLCPLPLRCEARSGNKFVCSCGTNRFYEHDTDNCHYFLDRPLGTGASITDCPNHANFVNLTCRCESSYIARNAQQCILILNQGALAVDTCVQNAPCANQFGGNTLNCGPGDCRCDGQNAYQTPTRCVTMIGRPGAQKDEDCPSDASLNGARLCQCNAGYRPSADNRVCERKITELHESTYPVPITPSGDVSDEDCRALYPDSGVRADLTGGCKCLDNTFLLPNKCTFFLGVSPYPYVRACPENAWYSLNGICECETTYHDLSGDRRDCVRKTNILHDRDDPLAQSVPGLTATDCRIQFGPAATVSQLNGFCTCVIQSFRENDKCYFPVDTDLGGIAVSPDSCPPTSVQGNKQCACPPGYWPQEDRHRCVRKPFSVSPLTTIDENLINTSPCNATFTHEDCVGLHGPGAVCYNFTCYCNRKESFASGSNCVPFASRRFPGHHERNSYTCSKNSDCNADADQNGIECNYVNGGDPYKVCRCKDDSWFDPGSQRCVPNRQCPVCGPNQVCVGYNCVCAGDFYRDPITGQCVPIAKLELYEPCNATVWAVSTSSDTSLSCPRTCSHGECSLGLRNNNTACVTYKFDNDPCVGQSATFCDGFFPNSHCDLNENRCKCPTGFYLGGDGKTCITSINGECTEDNECGDYGDCLNLRCQCKPDQRTEEFLDSFGRKRVRCIAKNGAGQLHFNNLLFPFMFTMVILRTIFV